MTEGSEETLSVEPKMKSSLSSSNIPIGKAAAVLGKDPLKPAEPPISWLKGSLRDVLLWKDVVQSTFTLAGSFIVLFVFFFSQLTPISYIAYTLLAAILANLAYVNGYKAFALFTGATPVNPNERHFQKPLFEINKQDILDHVSGVIDEINDYLPALRDILYCRNNFASAKAALSAYLVAWLGNLLPLGWTLLITVVVAFTLPVQYLINKELVDKYLELVEEKFTENKDILVEHVKNLLRKTPLKKYIEN